MPLNPRYHSLLLMVAFILGSCNSKSSGSKKENDTSTQSAIANAPVRNEVRVKYDITKPDKKYTLDQDLLEISGITWIDKSHLVAIEDLRPILYLIRLDGSATVEKKIPFHETTKEKFDVEDVTVVNNTAYALYSHGKIFQINNWNDKPSVKELSTFLSKENNTEGLCYDPVLNNLLVSCKNESDVADEKKINPCRV